MGTFHLENPVNPLIIEIRNPGSCPVLSRTDGMIQISESGSSQTKVSRGHFVRSSLK